MAKTLIVSTITTLVSLPKLPASYVIYTGSSADMSNPSRKRRREETSNSESSYHEMVAALRKFTKFYSSQWAQPSHSPEPGPSRVSRPAAPQPSTREASLARGSQSRSPAQPTRQPPNPACPASGGCSSRSHRSAPQSDSAHAHAHRPIRDHLSRNRSSGGCLPSSHHSHQSSKKRK